MITPSFSLTATERVLPKLALDFTTAQLDSRVTFTRSGNTATVTNSSGTIVSVNADVPRFDFDPSTLVCKGLLIEESRTNALLNSLIDGTSLLTQAVTVTAAARTLSFYGTGTVVLSGAHSATVVGSGAYPARTTLTFTPTAGALTLTVTGTVQYAQLETGAFATSFIPTGLTAVTRNADVATMTGTNFSDWFNASQGTFVAKCTCASVASGTTGRTIFQANVSGGTEIIGAEFRPTIVRGRIIANSGTAVLPAITASLMGTLTNTSLSYDASNGSISVNASSVTTLAISLPAPNQLTIGNRFDANAAACLNGTINNFYYYPQKLTDSELQSFSK
jgi:hypothetical protein